MSTPYPLRFEDYRVKILSLNTLEAYTSYNTIQFIVMLGVDGRAPLHGHESIICCIDDCLNGRLLTEPHRQIAPWVGRPPTVLSRHGCVGAHE
ncbi:hypothetical protein DMENIID0001_098630 [Sergentomyia squamirostris]